MAIDADYLVDRHRLKKRLAFWRITAIVIAVTLVAVAVGRLTGTVDSDYIARLSVTGVIYNDSDRIEAIEKARDDEHVKAIILRINSPGGTVVGGEALHRALQSVTERKPVVVIMEDLATSAGYMIAVPADRIFAREGTITGSIGVLFQTAEFTDLMAKLGISVTAIKSSPLKAEPSPFSKMTPEAREATQALVSDMHDMFISMVAKGRKITEAQARILADGRVYTGRMAIKLGLVDGIGGEDEARQWLESEKKISSSLDVRDIKFRDAIDNWMDYASRLAGKTAISERLTLDGLIAVWHPQL
jgi:protease-4